MTIPTGCADQPIFVPSILGRNPSKIVGLNQLSRQSKNSDACELKMPWPNTSPQLVLPEQKQYNPSTPPRST